MNLQDLAFSLQNLLNERDEWRQRALRAEAELENRYQADAQQLEMHQRTFGAVLDACLDPNNKFNREKAHQ